MKRLELLILIMTHYLLLFGQTSENDPSFNPEQNIGTNGGIEANVIQPDWKILIGGNVPDLISGNTSSGIIINGDNTLRNLIGLNKNGNISIPNNVVVFIFNSESNSIGGTIWSDTPPP